MIVKWMFLFFYFLVAHLMAEFVFHFKKVWEWEKKSSWGIIFHSFIFGVLGLILFFPFLNRGLMWWYVIFLSLMHFFIDSFKVSLIKEGKDADAVMFLDQVGHFFWIAFVAYFGAKEISEPWFYLGKVYGEFYFPIFINMAIICLFYREIVKQFKGRK